MSSRSKSFYNVHLDLDSMADSEPEAISSPGPHSSPSTFLPATTPVNSVPFLSLSTLSDNDAEDSDFFPGPDTPTKRSSPLSNTEKTRLTLEFMHGFSRFSLRQLLETLFISDDSRIKNVANVFLAGEGLLTVMENIWDASGGIQNETLVAWAVNKAAKVCAREASWLSDRASDGPREKEAKSLRVSYEDVNVKLINNFKLSQLSACYSRVTPHFQSILAAFTAADSKVISSGSRDPIFGTTLITSMALNLRSRKVNYHAVINSLIFWDNRVPKRLVQMFNHFGITASYPFQSKAIVALSKDVISLARQAANDPNKIKMLPYDNFNWTSRAWESTALHKSIVHDEVSALLVILPTPNDLHANDITNISHFTEVGSIRHSIPPRKSLSDILPTSDDQISFRANAIIHVQNILSEEIPAFAKFTTAIASIYDPQAMKAVKTEEYCLPTFDQEQGSTRGNMVVLEHYFGKVLAIPKSTFEHTMFTVLGDRLTTARDRAAQDQRAVDRSQHRFHHLSSISIVSGLMHFTLNFIQAFGGNTWGGSSADAVSLSQLCKILPNRSTEINLRRVDYYAWLRFLDVVLRGLVIRAAIKLLDIQLLDNSSGSLLEKVPNHDKFTILATSIVDTYIMPSSSRLEALGTKTLKGHTESGHAVLLMHDLMTLREMQHAIKHGHPTRILRMIKYWTPMFYAAGSHNYANECMELLHNVIHDWPKNYASVAFNGMLVNSSGQPDGWKPADIRVEHLNDNIKERAHGSNATPDILEKTTPAMGHVQSLSNQVFDELGVELKNQRHAKVLQHKDVEIITKHLHKSNVLEFSLDKPSTHAVVDLYRNGLHRLAGTNGGHAKHLKRHILRLRARHHEDANEEIEDIERELLLSRDLHQTDFVLGRRSNADELRDLVVEDSTLVSTDEY